MFTNESFVISRPKVTSDVVRRHNEALLKIYQLFSRARTGSDPLADRHIDRICDLVRRQMHKPVRLN